MELTEQDKAELSDIGFYWEGAYRVWHEGDEFRARRKGFNDEGFSARTAAELRDLIRGDYFSWLAQIRGESMSL